MSTEDIRVGIVDYGRRYLYMTYRDPETGKKIARSTGKAKRAEATKVAGAWEAELREGRYKSPSKVTWQEFRDRYESEGVAGLAEKTAQCVSVTLNSVEHLAPVRLLSKLDAGRVSTWQNKLRERGLSDHTIKSYTAHLKAALRWAKRVGILNVVPDIRMPQRAKQSKSMKGRPITTEEFERMLAKVPDILGEKYAADWQHFLRGLWWSGLRLGEALALTWDGDGLRVEMRDGEPFLHIPADQQKSNEEEFLAIAPEFAEMLLAVPAEDRVGFVFRTRTQRGESRRTDNVSTTICRFGKAAGIKVNAGKRAGQKHTKFASAHDLRRAFATRWAARLQPLDLKTLMRHDDIKTTERYYVERDAKTLSGRLRDALGNTLGNTRPETLSSADEETPQAHMADGVRECPH